jgi:hypothetical protein
MDSKKRVHVLKKCYIATLRKLSWQAQKRKRDNEYDQQGTLDSKEADDKTGKYQVPSSHAAGEYQAKCLDLFHVLPTGQKCIVQAVNSWDFDEDLGTTWVFTMLNNTTNPVSHLVVFLNPSYELESSTGATIFARATNGASMGEEFFVGTLTPTRPSCFIRVAPNDVKSNGITIFINMRRMGEVEQFVLDKKEGRFRRGPFNALN